MACRCGSGPLGRGCKSQPGLARRQPGVALGGEAPVGNAKARAFLQREHHDRQGVTWTRLLCVAEIVWRAVLVQFLFRTACARVHNGIDRHHPCIVKTRGHIRQRALKIRDGDRHGLYSRQRTARKSGCRSPPVLVSEVPAAGCPATRGRRRCSRAGS